MDYKSPSSTHELFSHKENLNETILQVQVKETF